MAELAEKSSLEILVPEVANNVLCSVFDSKTKTFIVSPFYSVIIVNPFQGLFFEVKRKSPSTSLMILTSIVAFLTLSSYLFIQESLLLPVHISVLHVNNFCLDSTGILSLVLFLRFGYLCADHYNCSKQVDCMKLVWCFIMCYGILSYLVKSYYAFELLAYLICIMMLGVFNVENCNIVLIMLCVI